MIRKPRFVQLLVLALSLSALAGCSTPAPSKGKPVAQMTFQHLEPIAVNAGAVGTVIKGGGDIPDTFVFSPATIFEDYFAARYLPRGGQDMLQATIEEASVKYSREKSGDDIGRFLGVAGFDVYNVTLRVRVEHLDSYRMPLYSSLLTAERIIKVSEHASISEREKQQLSGMEAMFRELDLHVRKVVVEDMQLRSSY